MFVRPPLMTPEPLAVSDWPPAKVKVPLVRLDTSSAAAAAMLMEGELLMDALYHKASTPELMTVLPV